MLTPGSAGKTGARPAQREARAYDLAAPPPLHTAELAALEAAAREVARTLGALLSEYLGRGCGVTSEGVHAEFPPPGGKAADSVWGIPGGADSAHSPIWRLGGGLARGLVDVLLGAEEPLNGGPGAGLTRVEARVLARLCRELHAGWSSSWPLRVAWPDHWRCVMAEPDAPGPQSGEWVRLRLGLDVCGLQGTVDAFLPVATARLPVPGAGPRMGGPRRMASELRAAPVTAAAVLGTWHTSLRELAQLQVGQVIPLGLKPGTPLVLRIAGSPKLTVQAGMHEGLVAVQVVGGDS